jgi:hypothetical protein
MAILGQAAAILYGTTAPSNKDVIWAETSTNDSSTWTVLAFYQYDGSTWVGINGIVYSATAPTSTNVIWIKTGGAIQQVYTHDGTAWQPLLKFAIVEASTGYSVTNADVTGQLLKSTATTTQTITLAAGVPEGTAFRAMRLGAGALRVEALAAVKINGITGHTVEIAAQWHSAWAICLGNDEWLIEGYLL